jgi:hypothetical protein
MKINKGAAVFLLIVCLTLLAIPIVWLTPQTSRSVSFLAPIIILGSFVIVNVIVRKTRYEPFQLSYQHNKGFYTVRTCIQ